MSTPLKILFAIDRFLARIEGMSLAIILVVMLLFASLQVFLRNIFDTGVEWGDVFARHLVLWVGFLGATLATQEQRHIRIDALLKVVKKRWLPLVELFVCFFCIVVGSLLFHAAYKFMMDEKMAETILFEGVPTWYFITIMPVGFALITFRYFIQFIELLFKFAGRKEELKKIEESPVEISVKVKIK